MLLKMLLKHDKCYYMLTVTFARMLRKLLVIFFN